MSTDKIDKYMYDKKSNITSIDQCGDNVTQYNVLYQYFHILSVETMLSSRAPTTAFPETVKPLIKVLVSLRINPIRSGVFQTANIIQPPPPP